MHKTSYLMDAKKFHSFVRLVRKMYHAQQDSYAAHNRDRNKIAIAKALEAKVSAELVDYPTGFTPIYEWQILWISIVKEVRSSQAMFYSHYAQHESILQRCKAAEARLGNSFIFIEKTNPEVLTDELPVQQTLSL